MVTAKRIHAPCLPHEIVINILLCLPASSLFSFRIVCKSWLSSITDPAFVAAHTKRTSASPTTLIVFTLLNSAFYFYDYASHTGKTLMLEQLIPGYTSDDNDYDDPYKTIRSVNGLQLLYNKTTIYVCNPCTRDIVALPPIHVDQPDEHDLPMYGRLGLVMGKRKSLGFGVDPSTGKYNVVSLALAGNPAHSSCHVFTQGSQSWRQIACPDFAWFPFMGFDPVCVNGVFYWDTEEYYGDIRGWIISLDLVEEKFALFRSPPVNNYYDSRRAEFLQGELCIVDSTATGGLHIVVWTRNEEKWSKSYKIKNRKINKEDATVLEIHEGKILIATRANLYSYDPKRKRKFLNLGWDKHWEKNSDVELLDCAEGALFTETLAPAG